MFFHIQPDSSVPIYEQIVDQVTFAIASGIVRPGDALPSVRDLGHHLVVNPNTVLRAYQELERLGVGTSRRGRPMGVSEEAPVLCRARRLETVRERIRSALREAASSGLTPEEIRTLVDEELSPRRAAQFQGKR
jgi:GntR family transcriptional regulator